MKTLIIAIFLCLITSVVFSQHSIAKDTSLISVPDFSDKTTKAFYQQYADHLIKCVFAIRGKQEAAAILLFKDPGENLVAREKVIARELVKTPGEKQKYLQFAAQAYPYIKEVERSAYYRKVYGK